MHQPAHEVTVALVGKYIDLPDAYLSVTEALRAGGFANDGRVEMRWVASDDCQTPEGAARQLGGVDAVCVPGGFGVRGIEGKLGAIRYARENRIPTLGLCLGLQCMVIEYARTVAGLDGANSLEFDDATPAPGDRDHGRPARRRRGGAATWAAPCGSGSTRPSSPRARSCARSTARRTSRSGTGTATRSTTTTAASSRRPGCVFSGTSPDGRLVEFVELPREVHPYFVGHPGPPGVPVPADPRAPAVRRPGRRRAGGRREARESALVELAAASGSRRLMAAEHTGPVRDERADLEVVSSETVFDGMVWDVRRDEVGLEDGQTRHPRGPRAHRRGRRRRARRAGPGAAGAPVPAPGPALPVGAAGRAARRRR